MYVGMEVKAATATSGDYEYEVNEDGNSVTILRYKGNGGNVVIPSEIDGKKVTSIGNNSYSTSREAFEECKNLTSVEIPNSITFIGGEAFKACTRLTSIEIPESVTYIMDNAFENCSGLTSIKVAEGNTTYNSSGDCNAIIRVNTLVVGCKNTVIPSGITAIGRYAFSGRSGLEKLQIPNGVKYVYDNAFSGCVDLTDIEIPDSIELIGKNAFNNCNSLTSIKIPENVKDINNGAFSGCSGLINIKVSEKNLKYDSRKNCNAIIETENNIIMVGCKNTIIPDSVTGIGEFAFYNCINLTDIEIPNNVINIGDSAFSKCNSLTSIEIPDSVTDIGSGTFSGCSNLTSVRISQNLTDIKNSIFYDCSSLTSVQIPNGVTNIGAWAFGNCSSLTNVNIPESVIRIDDYAFYCMECPYGLTSIRIPSSVTNIGEVAVGFYDPPDYDGKGAEKIPGFIIYGESGSEAENYAKVNGFDFNKSSGNTDISERNIAKAEVTLSQNSYTYDGWAKTPAVTVKLNGKTLKANKDYMVIYSNNIDIGTAKVIIVGKGDYMGNKTVNFTIVKATAGADSPINCKKTVYKVVYGAKPFTINASSKSRLSFTSSNPKVAVVNKNTGKLSIKGTGIATIIITAGKESVKVTVKVSPKKQSLKSAKAAKGRKLSVKWAKDKSATGYQVQVSTDKNFKKVAKQKNVTKNACTFKKLKAGKRYYVRVRSYKKSGMETLYGAWSKAKQSDKIKK